MIDTHPISKNIGSLEHSLLIRQTSGVLKPGQIINATVMSNSNQGHVELQIGNSILTASTNISLKQNTQLLLEVVRLQPQLLLRLVPACDSSTATKAMQETMVNLLSRHAGLAPSLAALLPNAPFEGKSKDHQSLRALFRTLTNAIPTRNDLLNRIGVRQAIVHSGLFLEAMLARYTGKAKLDTSKDIKACLLRLQREISDYTKRSGIENNCKNTLAASQRSSILPPRARGLPIAQARVPLAVVSDTGGIEESIPELFCRIQGAVARLGLLQVASSENFDNGECMWQLELPVKHNDTVETVSLSIKKDQKNCIDDTKDSWIVHLALDLPQLGAVEIRLSLYTQGVSACFWSDSTITRSLIESQFEQLKSQLEQHGLTTMNLNCQAGNPVESTPPDTNTSNIDFSV